MEPGNQVEVERARFIREHSLDKVLRNVIHPLRNAGCALAIYVSLCPLAFEAMQVAPIILTTADMEIAADIFDEFFPSHSHWRDLELDAEDICMFWLCYRLVNGFVLYAGMRTTHIALGLLALLAGELMWLLPDSAMERWAQLLLLYCMETNGGGGVNAGSPSLPRISQEPLPNPTATAAAAATAASQTAAVVPRPHLRRRRAAAASTASTASVSSTHASAMPTTTTAMTPASPRFPTNVTPAPLVRNDNSTIAASQATAAAAASTAPTAPATSAHASAMPTTTTTTTAAGPRSPTPANDRPAPLVHDATSTIAASQETAAAAAAASTEPEPEPPRVRRVVRILRAMSLCSGIASNCNDIASNMNGAATNCNGAASECCEAATCVAGCLGAVVL